MCECIVAFVLLGFNCGRAGRRWWVCCWGTGVGGGCAVACGRGPGRAFLGGACVAGVTGRTRATKARKALRHPWRRPVSRQPLVVLVAK